MKYLYIVLLSVFFTNCSSVPKEYLINDTICHYNEPIFKITKEELTLNNEILHLLKKRKKDTVIVNDKNFKNEFWYSEKESLTQVSHPSFTGV